MNYYVVFGLTPLCVLVWNYEYGSITRNTRPETVVHSRYMLRIAIPHHRR